jgi:hypothetical protein
MKARKLNILLLLAVGLFSQQVYGQAKSKTADPVALHWLWENEFTQPTGLSWGVPLARGTVKKDQSFSLTSAEGESLPLQSWPLAYWPDGSLKWVGFATVTDEKHESLQLKVGKAKKAPATTEVQVREGQGQISINAGALQCIIPKSGTLLLDSIRMEGRMVGSSGRLECVLQDGPDGEWYESPARQRYFSKINQVTVEQKGPIRAVVRVEGVFQQEKAERELLPFSVRLYFYAGSEAVRIVNTLIYDGDEQRDFIKGVGMVFFVPMREQVHNRHVRFGGEDPGVWAEPVRPLVGRRVIAIDEENVFPDQVAGKRVPNVEAFEKYHQDLIHDLPVWNDYKLEQHTADGFTIQKRTHAKGAWLDASAGKRATGLAFVGDVNGGLALGLKDFWQSYPAALEVRNAARDMAELRVWLWSPYADAMDMRHYDTIPHGLQATYEDVQEGLSTPYGVARTSELTLFASASVPSNEELSNQAKLIQQPPFLVASPEYLHGVNIFGVWSLPDRSTPGKAWVEDQLDKAIDFYQTEIDQRNWYGFWNYGDVMHAYDSVRHHWRYDIGGFAWANTELAPDMWLWYSFLRTGRADIFKMAEAMTRHTSEVDVYHLGELAGLGSRHNVRHWGCGSKEVRVSQAPYRRFYYYLTTDERTGDMMREVAAIADKTMTDLDPLRLILPDSEYPTHARVGPDWLALAGNWMTEWERTGDKKWRDKIMSGVNSFAKMPYGLFSGSAGAFGYDPENQKMYMLEKDAIGSATLTVLMGGPEVAFELTELLQERQWNKLWLQYAALYGAPQEEVKDALGRSVKLGSLSPHFARLPAYVARQKNHPAYARRAWSEFLHPGTNSQFDPQLLSGVDALKSLKEVPAISTNNTAQWSLNAIQLLELVGDEIPEEHPFWSASKEED